MNDAYSMKQMSLVNQVQNPGQPSCSNSVFLNEDLRYRILMDLKKFIETFLIDINITCRSLSVNDFIEFDHSYQQNPAREIEGATGYNRLLWLYIFCHCLRPEVIVESGVYVGCSLWTLRKASPHAEIYAFDLNLKRLKFQDENIKLLEMDWSQCQVNANSANDFCYFDDHINNCLRIKQAYERGFKHLIFDDSPSVMDLQHFRFPGVPTAQMLLDNTLQDGDVITWKWKDQWLRYIHAEAYTYGVRDSIDTIVVLPDLQKYTGHSGLHHFVYVRLK